MRSVLFRVLSLALVCAVSACQCQPPPGSLETDAAIGVPPSADGGANLAPVVDIEAPADGAYFDEGQPIELRGRAIDQRDGELKGLRLTWTSSLSGLVGHGSPLVFSGAPVGAHRVLLTATDGEGLSAQALVIVNVVPVGTNRPPAVTIVSPAPQANFASGAAVPLSGSASDPEDGSLAGSALAWSSDVEGALGVGATREVSTLRNGVHLIRLTATDSVGGEGRAEVLITVNPPNNAPPTATITAPLTGLVVYAKTTVTFEGRGTDAEDGALSGAALVWTSDKDGALGTGASVTASALSVGTHSVRLTVTDSGGSVGAASVVVNVLPENQAPSVTITSPMSGASFAAGSPVALRGSALDAEDGALTGNSLVWSSTLGGSLGTGASLDTSSLMAGLHTLTLTAVDSGGRAASASVSIAVTPSDVNLGPVPSLTGPSGGDTNGALVFDGSQSRDSDGSLVRYDFDFGDGTPAQSGTSATAEHLFTAPGTYVVKLTVTDDDGASASATLSVVIVQGPRLPRVVGAQQSLGSMCQLVSAGSELHVAFRELSHPSLYYARLAGGAWTIEFVDGMGLKRGGLVGERFSLAVDTSGVVQVAYFLEGQGAFWARRSATGWERERVDSSARAAYDSTVTLTLDGSQGQRPTVFFTEYGAATSYQTRVSSAVRGPGGAWTQMLLDLLPGAANESLVGDVLIGADGRAYIPVNSSLAQLKADTSAGAAAVSGHISRWASLAFLSSSSASSSLALIAGGSVTQVTIAAPFSASQVQRSLVEASTTNQHALAVDAAGLPRVALVHGSMLEALQVDGAGYWTRTKIGPADPAGIDVAVDAEGETRVCFFRNGKLLVY
jgi:PKD repeat protein